MEALFVLALPVALAAGRLHLHLRALDRQVRHWDPVRALPARRTPAASVPLLRPAFAPSPV